MPGRIPIAIVALHGGFGGAFNLNKAITECSARYTSTLLTSSPSYYSFGDGIDVRKQPGAAAEALDKTRRLLLCDCGSLVTLARYLSKRTGKDVQWRPCNPASAALYRWLGRRSLIFYWSGTAYCDLHDEINAAVAKLPCARRYAMCDILRYDPAALPLMQTYDNLAPIPNKFGDFTVCHSPGEKYASDKKGTSIVEAAIAEVGTRLPIAAQILKGVSHRRALVIKAMSHMFVDQIASAAGGLGKSGLEAMLLGVPTFCDLRNSRFEGYYEGMPAVDVRDKDGLVAAIEAMYGDRAAMDRLGQKCAEWSARLKFEPTVKYLERTMEWA